MTAAQCTSSNVLGPLAPEQRCAACPFRETCPHPFVDSDGDTAKCRTCPQRFGLCERHGMYPLVDRAGCPKCLPVGLGKVEASR